MTDQTSAAAREAHARRPLLVAYVMIGIALVIMFLGLTPIDPATWMSRTLHVPIGVVYLIATGLCFGAGWILSRVGYTRAHRIVRGFAFVFGAFGMVFSATTLTTFA